MKKMAASILLLLFLTGCPSNSDAMFTGNTTNWTITLNTTTNGSDQTATAIYQYTGSANLNNVKKLKLSFNANGNGANETFNAPSGLKNNTFKVSLTGSKPVVTKDSKVTATIEWGSETSVTVLNYSGN